MIQPRFWFLAALLVYSILMRLFPYILFQFGMNIDPETTIYPWNFSPILAICMFGGAIFTDRRWAYAVPFIAFLIGDLGIWALTGRLDWAFYPNQPVVYGSIALMVSLGLLLRKRRSVPSIAGTGLAGACAFYLITNFGVWVFGNGTMYPSNFAGLMECYSMAIPFFRNSLISMAVFLPLLFSPVALVQRDSAAGMRSIQAT